jgi:hypothetical protein
MFAITLGLLAEAGCPANGDCPPTGTTGGSIQLGGPVLGMVDNHCWAPGAPDGGLTFVAQAVNSSSCYVIDGGLDFDEDAGADTAPAYGSTEWNVSGNDDDCKYFVGWHSTPITAGAQVTFWVSVQLATNGAPLTGLVAARDTGSGQIYLEVAGAPDGGIGNHSSPTISGADVPIAETPVGSGVYQIGPAQFFDESGLWYIRFHVNENCADVLPDSPHGHTAFYVNVP